MLLFAFYKYAILWIIPKICELKVREEPVEYIGMHFFLFDLMQLALFDNLQTFLKIFHPVQFLIHNQLRYSLHPTLSLLLLILTG